MNLVQQQITLNNFFIGGYFFRDIDLFQWPKKIKLVLGNIYMLRSSKYNKCSSEITSKTQ
jgi:hypothetical protein